MSDLEALFDRIADTVVADSAPHVVVIHRRAALRELAVPGVKAPEGKVFALKGRYRSVARGRHEIKVGGWLAGLERVAVLAHECGHFRSHVTGWVDETLVRAYNTLAARRPLDAEAARACLDEEIRASRFGLKIAELYGLPPSLRGEFVEWAVKDLDTYRSVLALPDDDFDRAAARIGEPMTPSAWLRGWS